MNISVNIGNNSSVFTSDILNPVVLMMKEHYNFNDTWININLTASYGHNLKRGIYYNFEHVWPFDLYTKRCHPEFLINTTKMYKTFDYILDFQIENYERYIVDGFESKFRFAPLRYTSFFKKFDIISYENRPFDLQFECVIDTDTRQKIFSKLTHDSNISSLVSYTYNLNYDQKIKTKTMAKYGIDFPHYDESETINTFRIWEYACLNMPVILIDPYNITSTKYFENNIVKTFGVDFNPADIKEVCKQYYDYGGENVFEKLTYKDTDYDNYRLSIIKDYCDKTHNTIPDYVMYDDWHD